MQRKYIWTIYLIIGMIGITNSCIVDKFHSIEREFVYINETDHTIKFYIWAKIEIEDGVPIYYKELPRTVKILPNSKSKVFALDGNFSSSNLCQQLLEFVIGSFDEKSSILVDGVECFLFENSGFALASNYENEVFERDKRVRHTYTFTNADFEEAKPCEEEDVIEQD